MQPNLTGSTFTAITLASLPRTRHRPALSLAFISLSSSLSTNNICNRIFKPHTMRRRVAFELGEAEE